jgi:hypothetical protein
LTAEAIHVGWVLSIAPVLAKAERVEAAFSLVYVMRNLATNLKYLAFQFPLTLFSALAALVAWKHRTLLVTWIGLLSTVYLLFYAGSFEMNPRYSIQITVPMVLLAVSLPRTRFLRDNPSYALVAIVVCVSIPIIRPWQPTAYGRTLASDHATAVQIARTLGPSDLVITTEPEIFLNYGNHAMNAVYGTQTPERIRNQIGKFARIFYYAGVRTTVEGTEQWETDRRMKSSFELHLVDSKEFSGMRVALYELLQPLDGNTR